MQALAKSAAFAGIGKIWDNPSMIFDPKWSQYTTGEAPKGIMDYISRWGGNIYDMIGTANPPRDTTFYPNQVKPGMHDVMNGLFNTVTPSQKQLLAGEPDLKFMNRDILNAQLTDQRKQLREGINPSDVLSGADLSAFYNEIYKPGVDPKQALQNLAEQLFIQRGVEKGAKRSVSDETGKLTSLNQPTIKGKDPHRITQRLAKTYIPDDATFVDPETGVETAVTQEELIAAGIINAPKKKTTSTGGMYGGTGSGSGFSGFSGFGKFGGNN
jgi:hypothetical protein